LIVEAKQVVLDRSDVQLCKLQDKWSRDALVEIAFCNANYDQNVSVWSKECSGGSN